MKNTAALVDASREIGLAANAEKTNMSTYPEQNAGHVSTTEIS